MVRLISTGFPWLSVFAGAVFSLQGPCLQSRPSVIQTRTSLAAAWTSVALLAFEFSESALLWKFVSPHAQPRSGHCCRTVQRCGRGMKNDSWNPKSHFNQIRLIRPCCRFVDNEKPSRDDECSHFSFSLLVPKSVSRWHGLSKSRKPTHVAPNCPNTLRWQQWRLEV